MNKKIIKRIYNVVIILCFIGAIGWCFSHFYHGSDVVYTDDAQVNRHITPINTRVSGFIKEIRFSDYQHVKKGDTLVIIEDSEFRLHVAQAEAGLRGCISQHGNHHYQRADGFGRYRRGTCRHDERQAGFRPFCSPDEEGCGNPPAI